MTITTFRKLVAGAAFLLGIIAVPSVHAQAGGQGGGMGRQMGTPAERADQQITALTAAVKLTPEQVTKIKPILVKQYTDQAALMAGAQQGGDMAALRTQSQALSAKAQTEITALLTAEQKTAYTAYLAEQAARRGGMGGPGAGGPPRQQ
jgi:periplasmic protein CpxP/Spy